MTIIILILLLMLHHILWGKGFLVYPQMSSCCSASNATSELCQEWIWRLKPWGLFNVYTTSRGVLDYQKEEVLRLGVGNCWGNGSGMGTRAGARQLVYETGLR